VDPELRARFNDGFTPEKYQALLRCVNETERWPADFRISETPIFLTRPFAAELIEAATALADRVRRPDFQQHAANAIPTGLEVPNETAHPNFLVVDFGVCEVDGRLTRLWTNRNKRSLVETVHVQFAFDKADLSDAAQTALATIVKELKENPNLTVDLEGFTDSTGAREYNVTLSQRRVESVRRYLIEQGAELPRINSVGLGPVNGAPVNGAKEEQAKQRRVSVKLMLGAD